MSARSFCLKTYYCCCLQIIDWNTMGEKYIIISQKLFCSKAKYFLEEIAHYPYTNRSDIIFRVVSGRN